MYEGYLCTYIRQSERDMASVRLFQFFLWLCLFLFYFSDAEAKCTGCNVALGSYYVGDVNTTDILSLFNGDIDFETLQSWNPQLPNIYFILTGSRVRIPFTCDCLGEGDNRYLGHVFQYTATGGDTYETIASSKYANLTTSSWLEKVNSYDCCLDPKCNKLILRKVKKWYVKEVMVLWKK